MASTENQAQPAPKKGAPRWLVRSAIIGSALLPLPTVLAYGCDSPTQFDDLCGWVRDPNNCYRDFFVDVGASCGATPDTRVGSFAGRDKLGECYLSAGGVVVFEPPIDLALPPGDNPEPLKIKVINPDQTECAEFEFRAKYDFKATFEGDPLPDAGVDANDLPEEFILGGTFDMAGGRDSDILNVTCPGGETFTFDRLQVTRCREFEAILPHAEIDFSPGGIEQTGVIRLNVFYPPTEGELSNAQPVPINYFECVIPAAPPACENGVKDGAETDIDCGGGFCTSRCDDGQLCITDDDCLSSACVVDMGIKKCAGGAP
ncbi:MAG: hypothetical protein HOW73_36170 [Polyangiaceae bacterium]|nr:hypothetical protein [Polyangiaceae bacterium]